MIQSQRTVESCRWIASVLTYVLLFIYGTVGSLMLLTNEGTVGALWIANV